MIFELSHENITTALKEYMEKRNITQGKQFSFHIKTSRKGTKTSRAVIETLEDDSVTDHSPQQLSLQLEPKLPEIPIPKPQLIVTECGTESTNEEGTKAQPFKKLFS